MAASPAPRVEDLPVDMVEPGPNPRQDAETSGIDQLASSIREKGLLYPVQVRRGQHGRFTILDGERRWRAVRSNRMQTIRAIVLDGIDDLGAETTSLVANLQREDLTAMDEAQAFGRLREKGFKPEKIAELVSKSVSQVYARLQLLDLPAGVQVRIQDGTLAADTVRAGLEGIPPEYREQCAEAISAAAEAGVELGAARAKKIAAEVLGRMAAKPKRRLSAKDLTPSRRRRLNDERTVWLTIQDVGQAVMKRGGLLTMNGVLVLAEALARTSPRAREVLAQHGLHGRVTRDVLESRSPEELAALALEVALLTVTPDPEDETLQAIAGELEVNLAAIRTDAINQIRDELAGVT